MAAAAPGRRRRVVVGHEAGWGGASGGRGERDGRVKGRVEQLGPGGSIYSTWDGRREAFGKRT
jgi:hypothetical protein